MMASGPTPQTGPALSGAGRLKQRAEFQAVAKGRRFHTARMTVQGLARDPLAGPSGLRVGFTVTKKVGHATERNRIRRRFRAAVLQATAGRTDLPADIVLVGRRDALGARFPALVDDIAQALGAVTRPGKPSSRLGRRSSGPSPHPDSGPPTACAAPGPSGRAVPGPSPLPSSGHRRRESHDG